MTLQEMEARATKLTERLKTALGTEDMAEASADLVRMRELIMTTKELRQCPGHPFVSSRDPEQFKFEAERRLATVTNE